MSLDPVQLRLNGLKVGLDVTVIEKILQDFGPEVLALANELIAKGFSTQFVLDVINGLGPIILKFIQGDAKTKFSAISIYEGQNVAQLQGPVVTVLDEIVQALLPVLEKYGEQLLPVVLPYVKQYLPSLLALLLKILASG